MGASACTRAPETASESTLKELFSRPLIVGASISADHSSVSPGKRLARRFAEAAAIKTVARGGSRGREQIKVLSDGLLADRSVVVGVDLFFWDSADPECAASVAAVEALATRTKTLGLPLVLGNVPQLLPGRQPCRAALNAALTRTCDDPRACRLLDMDSLHEEILAGNFRIEDRVYKLRELLPDGLHMNDLASEQVAARLQTLVDPWN